MPRFLGSSFKMSMHMVMVLYAVLVGLAYWLAVALFAPASMALALPGFVIVSLLAALAFRFPDLGLACAIGIAISGPAASSVATGQTAIMTFNDIVGALIIMAALGLPFVITQYRAILTFFVGGPSPKPAE